MYRYKAEIVKIVDGDTFDFNVDLGFGLKMKIRVRTKDYDAPEVRGEEREEGLIVKQKCVELFKECKDIRVMTTKKGKYGRWIADIWLDGKDIRDLIDGTKG